MKFQFSTKAIMLATAIVAIACGGVLVVRTIWSPDDTVPFHLILLEFVANAPIWTPVAFVAFAFGRKKLTVPMTIGFALMEAAAIGIVYGVMFYRRGY